jgi:hypothetical protein
MLVVFIMTKNKSTSYTDGRLNCLQTSADEVDRPDSFVMT